MRATAAATRAEQEAAAWFARLNTLSIPSQALEEFQAWRRDPGNDAAYERIEAVWASAGRLADQPDTARAVAEALARGRRRRRFGKLAAPRARIAYGALAMAAVATLAVTLVVGRGETYRTGVGEQRLVSLADGSRLRLDTDTQVRVKLSGEAREIALVHGQAFFDVAPDPARPFVVRANDLAVRAVGTQFDVRRLGAEVRVTLVEGEVEVTDKSLAQTWRLSPGEGLAGHGDPAPPKPVDVDEATSWTQGRLIFRATPLAEAAAEVNRYSRRKVVVDAAALHQAPINGVFEAGDTQAFVSAVSELFQLQVVPGKDEIRLAPKA